MISVGSNNCVMNVTLFATVLLLLGEKPWFAR